MAKNRLHEVQGFAYSATETEKSLTPVLRKTLYTWLNSLRQSVAILLRPVAIRGHWLHRRSAFGSTGTGPFQLGFGHAGAGLRLQAGANVDDPVLDLSLAW
jgi:hypothetical protein